MAKEKRTPLSVIFLTYNEEKNIAHGLESVCDWASDVFVLDSYSRDKTQAIAERYDCRFYQREFDNYSAQRNWALDNLPLTQPWVLFLDADEQASKKLRQEIAEMIKRDPEEYSGFFIKYKLIMFGKWLRYGGIYPTWLLRLFRRGKGRYEKRTVNEHFILNGKAGYLANDILHYDRKGLTDWIAKHNRYAAMEAEELIRGQRAENIPLSFFGSQAERKRFLRYKIWNHLPCRGILHFLYKYVFRLGFLDGRAGFRFAVLMGMYEYWVTLKVSEKKRLAKDADAV